MGAADYLQKPETYTRLIEDPDCVRGLERLLKDLRLALTEIDERLDALGAPAAKPKERKPEAFWGIEDA
jgi:hypothetical protein